MPGKSGNSAVTEMFEEFFRLNPGSRPPPLLPLKPVNTYSANELSRLSNVERRVYNSGVKYHLLNAATRKAYNNARSARIAEESRLRKEAARKKQSLANANRRRRNATAAAAAAAPPPPPPPPPPAATPAATVWAG